MHGEVAADDEDEDVVEHPIIEAIEQETLEHGIFHAVNHGIEGNIETRKVVEGDLQREEEQKPFAVDMLYYGNPKRHEEVEPNEDYEEVKLVLGIAEENEGRERERLWKADAIKPAVMQEVEERPDEIRQDDGTRALLQEVAIAERLVQIHIVKDAESGNEEEDGYAEACGNLEERCQMCVGCGIHQVLRADMDADDTEHGNAADIFDGGEMLFCHRETSCRDFCVMCFLGSADIGSDDIGSDDK